MAVLVLAQQCGCRVRPTRYAPPASNPDLWPFDLETGTRVASKVGNLPSQFALSNYSLCTRRANRQTDRRTEGQKQRLLPPSLRSWHNKFDISIYLQTGSFCNIGCDRHKQMILMSTLSSAIFLYTGSTNNSACQIGSNRKFTFRKKSLSKSKFREVELWLHLNRK